MAPKKTKQDNKKHKHHNILVTLEHDTFQTFVY